MNAPERLFLITRTHIDSTAPKFLTRRDTWTNDLNNEDLVLFSEASAQRVVDAWTAREPKVHTNQDGFRVNLPAFEYGMIAWTAVAPELQGYTLKVRAWADDVLVNELKTLEASDYTADVRWSMRRSIQAELEARGLGRWVIQGELDGDRVFFHKANRGADYWTTEADAGTRFKVKGIASIALDDLDRRWFTVKNMEMVWM